MRRRRRLDRHRAATRAGGGQVVGREAGGQVGDRLVVLLALVAVATPRPRFEQAAASPTSTAARSRSPCAAATAATLLTVQAIDISAARTASIAKACRASASALIEVAEAALDHARGSPTRPRRRTGRRSSDPSPAAPTSPRAHPRSHPTSGAPRPGRAGRSTGRCRCRASPPSRRSRGAAVAGRRPRRASAMRASPARASAWSVGSKLLRHRERLREALPGQVVAAGEEDQVAVLVEGARLAGRRRASSQGAREPRVTVVDALGRHPELTSASPAVRRLVGPRRRTSRGRRSSRGSAPRPPLSAQVLPSRAGLRLLGDHDESVGGGGIHPRSIRSGVRVPLSRNGTRSTFAAYTRRAAEPAMAVSRRFRGDAFSR